jgi:hypothetical protein
MQENKKKSIISKRVSGIQGDFALSIAVSHTCCYAINIEIMISF